MSVSLPSRDTYVLDVPEVSDLSARFVYNYFVRDEGAIDDGGVDREIIETPSNELNSSFIKRFQTKIPRLVVIKWTPPGLINSKKIAKNTIKSNLSKITSESDASTLQYTTITLSDVNHREKFTNLASGSLLQSTLNTTSNSSYVSTNELLKKLPSHVEGEKIIDALTQPSTAYGGRFFKRDGSETTHNIDAPPSFKISINSKFMADMLADSIKNPVSQNGAEFNALLTGSLRLSEYAKKIALSGLDDKDSQLLIDPISIDLNGSSDGGSNAEIVGYLIEKYEHLSTENVILVDQIVIEDPFIGETADFKVKYGATYSYTIKTIAKFQGPGIDASTGRIAITTYLASSKTSNRQIVECIEFVAPPAPTELQPVWNYELEHLRLCWQYPINSQRDIKGFQVFRRKNISDPFELIRDIRFNDALVQDNNTIHATEENIDENLVDNLLSPVTSFVDVDFNKRSSYIYTICSIDAHGLTSNYGTQVLVSFDEFKNSLIMKHISFSGAPKAYPNMFLDKDLFVDTIRTKGGSNRNVTIYLTPETYKVTKNDGKSENVLLSKQIDSKYVLQIINLDRQLMEKIEISIDDSEKIIEQDVTRKTQSRFLFKR